LFDLWKRERRLRGGQRSHGPAIGWLLLLFSGVVLSGCRSAAGTDPSTTFQNIRNDFQHGNLNVARQKADKARNDYSAVNPEWSMRFRLLEAEILTYQGRRPEVLLLLNSPGITYPVMGNSAITRDLLCGLAHARLGQTQQADKELQEARRLSDASHSDLNGEVLRTEAEVQVYRGHLSDAALLSRQSLKVARDQRDSFLEATDLLNLGFVALQQEHYDEALALFNEAAIAARPIQARPVIEAAMGNMGAAYSSLGDYERALSSFQQAEEAARQIGTTSAEIDWLWSAGTAYYKLGNLADATRCYQESLKDALDIHSPEEIAGIHTQLAFLLYEEHQFEAARSHSDEAIQVARMSGDYAAELEPLFLQALIATQEPNGRRAERLLLQLNDKSTQSPSLRVDVENALANFYAARHQSAKADLWYRKSIHSFEQRRAAVKDEELRLPFFANGDQVYRDYAYFLIDSQKQEAALQLLDIGRAKTLAEGLGLPDVRPEQTVDIQAVARKLKGSILFYALGSEKSWLWSVTSHRTRLFVLPGQSAIESQLRAYQKSILKSSDPLKEANQTAKALYEALVGPVAATIPRGSKVFIIPDGILNGLNFETLLAPGTENPHYWIEDVVVSNANSIRLLAHVDEQPAADYAKKLLLIGNPTVAGTGYDTLVNAFAEIRAIEKHFPAGSRKVVTQSGAVPGAYAANKPDQFQYIHFVAHGTASRVDPLDSAVVLSPPAGHADNYKLYARDIMRCPLEARLVTISACYGSGLRAYAGEGLVGLSWAFLRAGAHNVIGALWEVNDASTPLLMDRLYGELEAGSTPDVALRAAKLSLIHSPAVYRKPLYWAAFQLYAGS
jgi:CHAT domain-containing protein/predicted negative regulator of RcsB-dependent stress response